MAVCFIILSNLFDLILLTHTFEITTNAEIKLNDDVEIVHSLSRGSRNWPRANADDSSVEKFVNTMQNKGLKLYNQDHGIITKPNVPVLKNVGLPRMLSFKGNYSKERVGYKVGPWSKQTIQRLVKNLKNTIPSDTYQDSAKTSVVRLLPKVIGLEYENRVNKPLEMYRITNEDLHGITNTGNRNNKASQAQLSNSGTGDIKEIEITTNIKYYSNSESYENTSSFLLDISQVNCSQTSCSPEKAETFWTKLYNSLSKLRFSWLDVMITIGITTAFIVLVINVTVFIQHCLTQTQKRRYSPSQNEHCIYGYGNVKLAKSSKNKLIPCCYSFDSQSNNASIHSTDISTVSGMMEMGTQYENSDVMIPSFVTEDLIGELNDRDSTCTSISDGFTYARDFSTETREYKVGITEL